MADVIRRNILTTEQRRQKKLQEWKLRRTVRYLQVRQKAVDISKCKQEIFWNTVDSMVQERIEEIQTEFQIEADLKAKKLEEEQMKREQEAALKAEQSRREQETRIQKKLSPRKSAAIAQQRFEKALASEKQSRMSEETGKSAYYSNLLQKRQMEQTMARIKAAHFRESQQPIFTHIPDDEISMDSMDPRFGLPVPTSFSPPDSSVVSPISTLIEEEPTPVKERVVNFGIPQQSAPSSKRTMKTAKRVLSPRKPLKSIAESVLSMDGENMEPITSPSLSIADLPTPRPPVSSRQPFELIPTFDQGRFPVDSSPSPRDSIASIDSVTLRQVLKLRAVQLSPPKQWSAPDAVRKGFEPGLQSPKRRILGEIQSPKRPARERNSMADLLHTMKNFGVEERRIVSDSFDWSVSTGPLTTPDIGYVGSNDSWLSYQSLEESSRYTPSELPGVESGTILSSVISSGSLSINMSVSSGNLDSRISEGSLT